MLNLAVVAILLAILVIVLPNYNYQSVLRRFSERTQGGKPSENLALSRNCKEFVIGNLQSQNAHRWSYTLAFLKSARYR